MVLLHLFGILECPGIVCIIMALCAWSSCLTCAAAAHITRRCTAEFTVFSLSWTVHSLVPIDIVFF